MYKQKKKVETSNTITENEQKMFFCTLDPYDAKLDWWETNFVKYAISYSPVKSQVTRLMESHIVRLTDRKFMVHLMWKLKLNHEGNQQKRVQNRKLPPYLLISKLLPLSYAAIIEKI